MGEMKYENVLNFEKLDKVSNKYTLVIEAAVEAKRLKQQDKDRLSLGRLSIEGLNRVLHKKIKDEKSEEKEK